MPPASTITEVAQSINIWHEKLATEGVGLQDTIDNCKKSTLFPVVITDGVIDWQKNDAPASTVADFAKLILIQE